MKTNVHRQASLTQYLRMGNWSAFDAAHILSDVDPGNISWSCMGSFEVKSESDLNLARLISDLEPFTIDDCPNKALGLRKENPNHKQSFQKREKAILDKLRIMFSESPNGLKDINKKPKEWVNWALKKKYSINWLEFALDEKLVKVSLSNIKKLKKKITGATINSVKENAEAQTLSGKETSTTEEVPTNVTKTADSIEREEFDIASLFDPLPSKGITEAFLIAVDSQNKIVWHKHFERAARNGLKNARVTEIKPFKYNLSRVGDWLVNEGILDRAKVDRILVKNLPRRNLDQKYLITGIID